MISYFLRCSRLKSVTRQSNLGAFETISGCENKLTHVETMQTNHSDASTLHDSSDSSLKTPAKAKTASEPPDAYKDNADKAVVFVLGENERLN